MTCDGCEESRRAGHGFCIRCGEPLDGCPECESSREAGRRFCIACGRPLGPVRDGGPRSGGSGIASLISLVAPVLLALMVAEAAAMVLGIGEVWDFASGALMDVHVLMPWLATVGQLGGTGLQLFWLVLVASVLSSLAILVWQTVSGLRGPGGREGLPERFQRTPLFWLCMLLCASLLLNVVIVLPQMDTVGGSAASNMLTGPEALLAYANAAVWEEVIARVAFIGVPMTMLALVMRRRGAPLFLLGGFGVSRIGLVLLVVSALVFGFAHSPGWGVWKVLPTFVTGLSLGYLYMRFGIHVSIAFHFAVDYMAVLLDGALVYAVGIVMLVFLIAGVLCLVEIVRRVGNPLPELRAMPGLMPPDQESIFRRRD